MSIEELEIIFNAFTSNTERMKEISRGEDWKVSIFRPFERNGIRTYSFRLYGKVSGSKYDDYNKNLQWCGGVDYKFDIETNILERNEYEHKLHDTITKHVDVFKLLQNI